MHSCGMVGSMMPGVCLRALRALASEHSAAIMEIKNMASMSRKMMPQMVFAVIMLASLFL